MRIVHVPTPGDHYSPSTGSALMTVVYELNRRHVERGDEAVVVVSPGTRQDYGVGQLIEAPLGSLPTRWQKVADAAFGAFTGRRPFSGRIYLGLRSLDLAESRLVVHNTAGPIRSIAAQRPDAKICLYAHNQLFRSFTRREARRTVEACYRVICVSHFIADELSEKLGMQYPHVKVVHNGVDTDYFQPPPPPDDVVEPVILFVGRVVPEKGVHLLIDAALEAQRRGRQFRLRIVGSHGFASTDPLSEYEAHLRMAAEPLNKSVEFVPFRDRGQIVDEYRQASIFVVPSDWDDPCPLTIGEGMASGLPIVASRRGGIPELGANAVLWFDPPDTEELAGHLVALIDSPEERLRLGALARKRAECLSWDLQYEEFRQAIA